MGFKIDIQRAAIIMGEKQMTQKELAGASGLSRQTVSAVMCGKYCSPITATKIANALMVPAETLIQRTI